MIPRMIGDFTAWREEVLFTGAIPQDGDTSIDAAEAERRCDRYVELLEMIEGDEGDEVFQTIIDSMVAEDDYEVYQASLRIAFRFSDRFGSLLFRALKAGFLDRDPERAADWLGQLAFLGAASSAVRAFNTEWSKADQPFSGRLAEFVEINETDDEDGWLSTPQQMGVLRPAQATDVAR